MPPPLPEPKVVLPQISPPFIATVLSALIFSVPASPDELVSTSTLLKFFVAFLRGRIHELDVFN
jgi:hypothetical protein